MSVNPYLCKGRFAAFGTVLGNDSRAHTTNLLRRDLEVFWGVSVRYLMFSFLLLGCFNLSTKNYFSGDFFFPAEEFLFYLESAVRK